MIFDLICSLIWHLICLKRRGFWFDLAFDLFKTTWFLIWFVQLDVNAKSIAQNKSQRKPRITAHQKKQKSKINSTKQITPQINSNKHCFSLLERIPQKDFIQWSKKHQGTLGWMTAWTLPPAEQKVLSFYSSSNLDWFCFQNVAYTSIRQ